MIPQQGFYEEDDARENLSPDTGEPIALPTAHADLTRTTTYIAKRVLDVHPHMVQSYACIETAVSKLAFYGTFARARDLTDAEIKHIRDVYIAYFQGHSVRCSGCGEEDELIRTAVQDSRSHFNLEQCQIYALAGLRIGRLWNRTFPDIPASLNYAQMYVNHFLHPEVEVLWELPQGVFP